MKTRKDMSQRNSDQAPITFYEVAAYFSEEEWKLLHEWQKELYKSVMKEIQQAVISLGPLIATSVFALKPKTKDKMDQIDNMDSEISIMNSDLRDETVKSDMPLRKTRMAAKHLKAAPDTDPKDIHDDPVTGHMIVKPDAAFTTSKACQYQKEASDTYTRDSQDGLTSGYQTLNSNNNLRMVQELEPKFMDDYGSTEIDSNIHPCLGHEDPSAVSFSVKEEGGTYFMDHPDAEEIENITETPRFPFHRNEIEASLREHRGKEESSRSLKSVPNVTTLPSIGINEEGETYQIEINGHRKREKMIGPTGEGIMKRKRKNRETITYTEKHPLLKASLEDGNAKIILKSQKQNSSEGSLWSETNCEARGETATGSENGFRNGTHTGLHQGVPEEGEMDNINAQWSTLWNAPVLMGQANAQQSWEPYNIPDYEKGKNLNFIDHQRPQAEFCPKEGNFQCSECHKSFSQKRYLICHQRIHSEERPYHCSECDKSFCHKHHLIGHQRTHSGEKPFQCTRCSKNFTWKDSLRRHERTHMETTA
ncbi:zinc finger protein 777-like [Pleurodeles waltl]|uniref:zinc finger protein 777-like n=1 Tax=Pleurodeles waltl TaxID=8319 RepID=UPI003709BA98